MKRFVCLVLLAACARPEAARPVRPDVPPQICGAASREDLVGRPGTALERVLILGRVRVLRPGDPRPSDLQPERLNFEIDPAGRISAVYCG